MNINQTIEVLNLLERLIEVNLRYDKYIFDDIDGLRRSFMDVYYAEKAKLPYHINIVDLLGAIENAHSRILEQLLKQSNSGRYEILESFFRVLI